MIDTDLAAQFAAMGASVETPAATGPDAFEVMPANADAISAWVACETQWRVAAGMAGMAWLGLDYGAVDVVLRRLKFADPDALFVDLQLMEGEALSVLWETDT